MLVLETVLSQQYGFATVRLTVAPRGFVAETYYVDTETGRYFAKWVKSPLDAELVLRSLPVLLELHRLGLENITYPILTADGRTNITLGNHIIVLFNYLEGQWLFDYPFEPYVNIVGRLHQLSDQVQTSLPRETFAFAFREPLLAYLSRLWNETFAEEQGRLLQTWVLARREAIERDFAVFEHTADQLRASQRPFVLTHGDAPGNVLYDGERVYLVDWDMLLFAPPERDTWFHLHQPDFLPLYRKFVPDYEFDPLACRFYLYLRYFEDLYGFVDKVLSPDIPDDEKTHHLHELYKTCDEWLGPLMNLDRQ